MKAKLEAYFLVGPTAVGKSAVAHVIAEKRGYEILSADSMLIYCGMDVGTAKPDASQQASVRYGGIDVVAPDKTYSAGGFRSLALQYLRDANSRGSRVIVAGGTGLYVKALVEGLRELPAADDRARALWDAVYKREGVEPLQNELRRRNPAFYHSMADKQNGRRLIRALEVLESGCATPCRTWNHERHLLVGLQMPAELLNRRIEHRVREMYDHGLLHEVRRLMGRYPALSATARQAIGYAEAIGVVEGRWTTEAAIQKTILRTRQLAKRQRTWFRHQADVAWIDVSALVSVDAVADRVEKEWEKHGPTEITGSTTADAGV